MRNGSLFLAPLVLLVVGCGDKTPKVEVAERTERVPQDQRLTEPAIKSDAQPGTPSVAQPPQPLKNEQASTTRAIEPLPATLKSAAYEYYGLGNTKPIDYELVGDNTTGVRTGSQLTALKEVRDGKASFVQTRTGGLAILGDDELSLDAEGVHVKSSTVESVDPTNLEFPADISTGKTWTSHDKISQTGTSFDITTQWTIKGIRSVKTPRGVMQALMITSTGSGTENGQKLRMESETYYAKGIGLVKAIIKTSSGSGKTSSITQQLAK